MPARPVSTLRPHDLRHRFGCRTAEKVPLQRLAQIMGRAPLHTTMRYIQGTPQDLQQAVGKLPGHNHNRQIIVETTDERGAGAIHNSRD
jgi:integrase